MTYSLPSSSFKVNMAPIPNMLQFVWSWKGCQASGCHNIGHFKAPNALS
jgi:hypothetical protein